MTEAVRKKTNDFFSRYPKHTYQRGHLLELANEDITAITYLIAGEVRQYDISPSGETIVINIFKPGAFFPMSNAINKTPNRYFFEAASIITVHRVPPEDAVSFIQDNSDVAFDLLRRVYIGTEGVLQRLCHLLVGNASMRLLFEIYNATLRFGEKQPDQSWALKITQSELAQRTGLARETINRELTKFKAKGLIKSQGTNLYISDINKIEDILDI